MAKYWDIDSEEFDDKKQHLINYLMKNRGGIKQVEREKALELGSQLDYEAFVEYVESLNAKFNSQYKAAFRKHKSTNPFSGDDSNITNNSKPVRLSATVSAQLDRVVNLYELDKPEDASKANNKAELLENALDHLLSHYRSNVNPDSVK